MPIFYNGAVHLATATCRQWLCRSRESQFLAGERDFIDKVLISHFCKYTPTRKKAMRLKAAHAHSFTHPSGTLTPASLSVPPSPHPGHSETSSPPPTPLIGSNPPEMA